MLNDLVIRGREKIRIISYKSLVGSNRADGTRQGNPV